MVRKVLDSLTSGFRDQCGGLMTVGSTGDTIGLGPLFRSYACLRIFSREKKDVKGYVWVCVRDSRKVKGQVWVSFPFLMEKTAGGVNS